MSKVLLPKVAGEKVINDQNFQFFVSDLLKSTSPGAKLWKLLRFDLITSAIRKFMLDMPSPGSFPNIGLLI